jgi:DNA-binding HxlR family transcriptional regulator
MNLRSITCKSYNPLNYSGVLSLLTLVEAMALFKELLAFDGNIPIILDLEENGRAYQKQLERRVGVTGDTVKRSVDYLLKNGLVKKVAYDGKVPNVDSWLELTELGKEVGHCLQDCRRKLSRASRR